MRAKDVVGKRIVRVLQERVHNIHVGKTIYNVTGFVLDDGTVITLHVAEDEYDYQVEAMVSRLGGK